MLALFEAWRGTSCFDCVMCYSGGKDSTFVLIELVQTYGLKPLALTIDNGFITPPSKANVEKVVSSLGVEHHYIRINWDFMKRLIRASLLEDLTPPSELKRVSSVCSSCIFLVNSLAVKYALTFKIPLVVAGFTVGQAPAAIYGHRLVLLDSTRRRRVELLKERLGDGASFYFEVGDGEAASPYPIHVNPMLTGAFSEDDVLNGITQVGWKKPPDTGKCSTNCGLNALGNYVHFLQYGFNPYARETAELVRAGLLSRKRAIEIMEDVSFNPSVGKCLARLGITHEELLANLRKRSIRCSST